MLQILSDLLLCIINIFSVLSDFFACGFVWVWNFISDIKRGLQTEGVWEQGAGENICTEEGWSDRRLKKTA
jgi:hypothetical protein